MESYTIKQLHSVLKTEGKNIRITIDFSRKITVGHIYNIKYAGETK